MTEERRCGTCGHYVSDRCVRTGGCCFHHSNWQPIAQKKPMENKVIFESEEECAEFLCNVYNHNKEYCLRSLVPMAKQKGYIRKSAVEEAEDMYNTIMHGNTVPTWDQLDRIITKYREAVQDLKSEIARLKK